MKVSIYFSKTYKDSSAALVKAMSEGSPSPEIQKILLVPDKLTLSAETEALYASKTGGTFNVRVYSFTRLCSVLARGTEKGKYLNKQSSVELFARIIAENADKLKYFASSAGRDGFAEVIYNTVSKLRYCLITPDMLKKFGGEGRLKAKTDELAFLYEKYTEYIKDRFFDSSTKLDILYNILDGAEGGKPPLSGAHVYLKDYDNFSRQEMRIIKKMTQTAESLSVACAYDTGKPHLFKNEIYNGLLGICADLNIKPGLIDANSPSDPVTEHVKKHLFSYGQIAAADAGGRVRLVSAADAYGEAEAAARHICAAVRKGARYKDFTVVAASLADYRPALSRAFALYGVPCFLDEGTALCDHALGRFLLAVAEAKTEGLTLKTAIAVVKNFFGAPEHSDAFENYCLRHGIRSFGKDFGGGKYAAQANEARKELAAALKCFEIPKTGKVETYTAAVREFLKKTGAEEKLILLAEKERAAGAAACARVTEQVLGKIEETLSAAESVLSGYFVSDKEFVRILSSGIGAVSISVVPMKLDCVYAGELTTSKYHAVKNLIVLGCIDGVIPGESKDTGLLSESNIRALSMGGINVEPGIAAENAVNKFNVYQLICETGNIYLSYPLADCKGQKNKESRLFSDFAKMFVTSGAEELPFEETVFTRRQAGLMLSPAAEKTDKNQNALFYALGGDAFAAEETEEAADTAGLYDETFSCSKIETFFDCPYKHFLKYGLRLKRRELADIMPFDTGTILHAVAENFVRGLSGGSTEAEVRETAVKLLDNELNSDDYKKFAAAANFTVLRARLAAEAQKFCLSIFDGIKNSDFVPDKDKLEMRFESGGMKGFIDRVDIAGGYVRVIDYKTGDTDAGFKYVYTGRKLQLFTYLSEAVKKTGLIPAGAYYFPVSNDYVEADGETAPRLTGYTLRDAGAVRAADKTLAEGTSSAEIPAKLATDKKTGALTVKESWNDKILSAEQMDTLIRYAAHMTEAAKKEIKAGNIKVSPFEGACGKCDFSVVCAEKEKPERTAPAPAKKDFKGV